MLSHYKSLYLPLFPQIGYQDLKILYQNVHNWITTYTWSIIIDDESSYKQSGWVSSGKVRESRAVQHISFKKSWSYRIMRHLPLLTAGQILV